MGISDLVRYYGELDSIAPIEVDSELVERGLATYDVYELLESELQRAADASWVRRGRQMCARRPLRSPIRARWPIHPSSAVAGLVIRSAHPEASRARRSRLRPMRLDEARDSACSLGPCIVVDRV